MVNTKTLKHAYVASVCGHPNADLYMGQLSNVETFDDVKSLLKQQKIEITKADFFTPLEGGRCLLDHKESWNNFERIVRDIASRGEKLEVEDFLKPIKNSKYSLLRSSMIHGASHKVFAPSLWQGRFEQVEALYYSLNRQDRGTLDDLDILNLKRDIYALDNKMIREDFLSDLGLNWKEFPEMFKTPGGLARLGFIHEKLKRHGSSLKKSDLFLSDADGDTMFYYKSTWDAFPQIVEMLQESGESFTVEDLTKNSEYGTSLVSRAKENDKFHMLFLPKLWVGCPQDLLRFWNALKPIEQNELGQSAFIDRLSQVENLTYEGLFVPKPDLKVSDIKKPLMIDGETRIYPLGLTSTWSHWSGIEATLKSKKSSLTAKDFTQKTGYMNRRVIDVAVHAGYFENVVDHLIVHGHKISADVFVQKDQHGQRLLQKIMDRGELPVLFKSNLWVGQMKDLQLLWSQIPIEHKKHVNWKQVSNEVRLKTLQKNVKVNRPKLKRR